MGLIHIIRLAAFGTVLLFSVIVLGLAANLEALARGLDFPPASLAVAVSVLTMVTVVPILIIERIRKNAVTSLVFVELIWVGLLWVLWLATGSDNASLGVDPSLCSSTACSSVVAITAFSFLNWIILLGWFSVLLVFSVIGNHWQSSVSDTDITKRNTTFAGAAPPVTQNYQSNMSAAPTSPYGSYNPQQQVHPAYPPSQQAGSGYQMTPPPHETHQAIPQAHSPGSVPV